MVHEKRYNFQIWKSFMLLGNVAQDGKDVKDSKISLVINSKNKTYHKRGK